jgi:hypothetical protein
VTRRLQEILDGTEVPDEVPHWIVESHWESDTRHMTPLQAVKTAAAEMREGHCWIVTHVRSGLRWSVDLGRGEEIELMRPDKVK